MQTKRVVVFALFILASPLAPAQQDTTWQAWGWLLGEWAGEGSGSPGEGSGWFSLTPALEGRVLLRMNHAEYPASASRPAAVHEDLMIVYRDSVPGPALAIYFDSEGHVINYRVTASERAVVLTSVRAGAEPIFRLSYSRLEGEVIDVAFEMSRDGERFMTYLQGKCRRRK